MNAAALAIGMLAGVAAGAGTGQTQGAGAIDAKVLAEQAMADDKYRCLRDPRFDIGGSMIGDCLMEIADAVDRQIESAVAEGQARYCLEEDRRAYRQAHAHWQAYRRDLCDLVERSPGNTGSWVDSAACRLELGRQRLASLRFSNDYGWPHCPVAD